MRTAVVILMLTLVARAAAAQTAPASRPIADDIRTWFRQLSDPSPDVRDRARTRLMTMPRSRLPELKRVVADARPLSAAQAVELREIVQHVFLAGEEYFAEPRGRGFIGVEMSMVVVPESDSGEVSSNSTDRAVARVMITNRLPGFNAYPMLRDGDVILRVVGVDKQLSDSRDLQNAMIGKEPGTTIELEVQRAGQVIRVPIRLSRRPIFHNGAGQIVEQSTEFASDREDRAAKYWQDHFAGLLGQQTL